MALNTQSLRDLFRLEMDDAEMPGHGDDSDSLWKDTEIYRYIDLAQRAFAVETDFFKDSTTPDISVVTVTANDEWVDLDPRIIRILNARLVTAKKNVEPVKEQDVEQNYYLHCDYGINLTGSWRESEGKPDLIVTDMEHGKGRLVPKPTDGDTLNLQVVRYPLKEITGPMFTLELQQPDYQYMLLDYMKYLAYNKQDADAFNEQLSQKFLQSFVLNMARVTTLERRKTRPAGTTRYGGL